MNILFLGGDKRFIFMMENLLDKANIYQIGFKIQNSKINTLNLSSLNFHNFDVIVFPISGFNDNLEIKSEMGLLKLPLNLFDNISENNLFFTGVRTEKMTKLIPDKQLISFFDYEEVEKVNNSLTIDGVIDNIKNRKKNSICILGYGHLGKELYLRLKDSDVKTYVISKPKESIYTDHVNIFYPLNSQNIIEVFNLCDIVVNTIPCNIISEDIFSSKHIPYLLDIASSPYGINQNIIAKYKDKIEYNLYLGIPSKFAPKEASEILLKIFKKVVNLQ